jgi:hypothetical protein
VEAICRASGSVASAATSTQTRSRPGVLYVDRGVIVLNKPPGLISQAAGPSHGAPGTGVDVALSGKHDCPPAAPPPRSAFNDVLDGTFIKRRLTKEIISARATRLAGHL